jgi:hypothetical protein
MPIENHVFKTFPDHPTAASHITGQGGVCYIAHPYWSGLPPEVVIGVRVVVTDVTGRSAWTDPL